MIAVIDNYDSFTYNLVQYLGELGSRVRVFRNDTLTAEELLALKPEKVIISPGPGRPIDAGISLDFLKKADVSLPVLGVCLGHQCIGYSFGARILRAKRLMHGKTSMIFHNKKGIFKGLPNPFQATRYHSLIVESGNLPKDLAITAWTKEKEIMGLEVKKRPVFGVQFHPESILTVEGKQILKNFLEA